MAQYSFGADTLFTPVATHSLPAVGSTANRHDLVVPRSLRTSAAINTLPMKVVSVDAAARSWTRQRPAASGGTFVDTVFADNPATGYVLRPAGTVNDSTGASVSFSAAANLPLVGMEAGVAAQPNAGPAQANYVLSVNYR